jgi:hypothetical protein
VNLAGVARKAPAAEAEAADARVSQYDWQKLSAELSGNGCAVIEKLLSPKECREIAAMYPHEQHFRSHVQMARHGFGRGEYRYFNYPLPDLLEACARRSILIWRPSPMIGMRSSGSSNAILRVTRNT